MSKGMGKASKYEVMEFCMKGTGRKAKPMGMVDSFMLMEMYMKDTETTG